MTNSLAAAKNLDLAFEVAFQWLADAKVVEEVDMLASDGTLVLYDDADEELTIANDQIAAAFEQRGEAVVKVALQRRTTLNRR